MNNENHSINNVKINISSNKKATNLHASFKDFFEDKIKPFIIERMDSLDQSINISINQVNIDLETLIVADLNNISNAEEEKLIDYFKQQFNAKISALMPSSSEALQTIDIVGKALKRGFLSGLNESIGNGGNLEIIIDELSNSEARKLHHFLIKNKQDKIIIHRVLQQFKPKQIESFFAKINPNILLAIKELDRIFNLNQAILLITKSDFRKAVEKYFISNKVSVRGNVNEIVSHFFEYKLNILIEELELQVQGEKLLSNSKERDKYFKEKVKKYDLLITELILSIANLGGLMKVSKEEWIFLFQNFLLESSHNSEQSNRPVKLFMETRHNSILSNQTLLPTQEGLEFKPDVLKDFSPKELGNEVITDFIKTGSFPLQLNVQSESAILSFFLAYTQKYPFQIRGALLTKASNWLWDLLKRLSEPKLEKFVHVFSPNFLLEKTMLFDFLESLVKNRLVAVKDMQALKKEFNSTTLQRLIYRKETYFKPTKELFSQWVVLGKVAKNEKFNSEKWKGFSSSDTVRMVIEVLEETKQPIELRKKKEKIEDQNTTVTLDAAFYSNTLSHYILFNELPWWGIMQLRNAEGNELSIQKGDQIIQVQRLISQFKKSHNIYYVKFINFIKKTPKLLQSLIYTIDTSIFNFLLQDFISTNSIVQLKLFLKDLNLVTLFLLDSSINIKSAQNSIVFDLINSNNEKSLKSIFDHILEDFLSNYKASRNILNAISNENLTSHYFNSKRVEEMLKLVLNVKSEIPSQSFEIKSNLGQINYLLSNILHVNLMGELIDFFKTGILIGSLSNDRESYLSFVKESLANSSYQKLILENLKKSAFPLEYFLFNARFQIDRRGSEELSEKTNLREIRGEESDEMILTELDEIGEQNEIELKNEELAEETNLREIRGEESEEMTLTELDGIDEQNEIELKNEELAEETNLREIRGEESEEMTLTELDEIGEQNEIELKNELVSHNKSIELNLAIFKYFIYNNELPWWSPFENLKTFQIQFILLFNENRVVFFKELELIVSDSLISEKMISFYNFQLNEPNKIDQLADGVIKELITIIRQIWPANKKSQALIVQLSDIKLVMYYDLTATAQTSVITLLLEYTIRYVWIEFIQRSSQFVNQIKTLVTSINRNFNLSIEIGPTFNEFEEWAREDKNETRDGSQTSKIGKSQLDKKGGVLPRDLTELDSDFYNKLVSLGRNKLNEDDRRIPAILLLTKPFVMANDYKYYQGVILDLVEAFNPVQKSSDALEVFNSELIKVLHGLLTQNGAYKGNELIKKILEQLSADQVLEQEWVYEIQLQLSDYENAFQNELTANTTIINEMSGVLKEIYPIGIDDKILTLSQLFVSQVGLSEYNLNSTFLSFIHYLSLSPMREVNSTLLSFFRAKSITNTALYSVLLDITNGEVMDRFETDNSELLVNIEFHYLANNLDLFDVKHYPTLSINQSFQTINLQKWKSNAVCFLIKQWARIKGTSLTEAFDSIKDKVINEERFSGLRKLQEVLTDFEKTNYFTLEEDAYSKVVKELNILDEMAKSPSNVVKEFMLKMKFNDQLLNKIKNYFEKQQLQLEPIALTFVNDSLLSDIKKGEQLQIYNAGLALIWPFVGTLFTRLGYIKDKAFIDKESQFRAVHLLQYIIDGGDTSPEFVLVFNKLICGIPLADPLDMFVALTNEEKQEADQLLESIKSKWKEMKNTSLATFRDSFLKRGGALTFDEKNWKLKVESKPIDVLLRKLPWGISLIKFHWINYMIFVEWTTKN